MTKYCLFDRLRKEFVIKEGKTMIGNRIVYETSKSPAEVTEIVSKPIADNTLRKLEKGLELAENQLISQKLTDTEYHQIKRYQQLGEVQKALENYLDKYSDNHEDVEQLIARFCSTLDEYGLYDDLVESLEE